MEEHRRQIIFDRRAAAIHGPSGTRAITGRFQIVPGSGKKSLSARKWDIDFRVDADDSCHELTIGWYQE